jgi:SAM-dependent methyltransferase
MALLSPRTEKIWRTRLSRRVHWLAEQVAPPDKDDRLRRRVGGNWEVIGRLQFDFLIAEGLRPEHRFIDVGCGTLRGGVHYVRHLESGHYHGIDLAPEMIEGGRRELAAAGLGDRVVHLRQTDTFDVDFGVAFDYGIALSVFTHVSFNSIVLCLTNLSEQLAVGGRFYASFFRCPDGPDRRTPIVQPHLEGYSPATSYCDRNNYHYSFADLEQAARGLPLTLEDLGDWGHPRGQQMLRVTRTA